MPERIGAEMQTKFTSGDRVTLHLPARIVSAMMAHGTIYYSVTEGGNPFPLMIPEEYITKDEKRIDHADSHARVLMNNNLVSNMQESTRF